MILPNVLRNVEVNYYISFKFICTWNLILSYPFGLSLELIQELSSAGCGTCDNELNGLEKPCSCYHVSPSSAGSLPSPTANI